MAKITELIPTNTLAAIKDHLIKSSQKSERRWSSVKDEEDSVTGDFCGQLSTDWTKFSELDHIKGRWRINYRKFGSRRNSLEPKTGADGIFQIAIFNSNGKNIYRKGILFQAKKEPIKNKGDLLEQIEKMNNYTSEIGNAVFIYGENGYFGMTGETYLENPENRNFDKLHSIGRFLADEFIECNVGVEDLYFRVLEDKLIIPNKEPLKEYLKHNMIIEVKPGRYEN